MNEQGTNSSIGTTVSKPYVSGRVYERETPVSNWSPPTPGDGATVKERVKQLIATRGQPSTYNFVESKECDVLLLGWESGEQVRAVFDKIQNYEIIHCPTCCRQFMPPSYHKPVQPCIHEWEPKWFYDGVSNMWRCSEVTRDRVLPTGAGGHPW